MISSSASQDPLQLSGNGTPRALGYPAQPPMQSNVAKGIDNIKQS